MELEGVTLFLTLAQSQIAIGGDPNRPIKSFRESFPDFITDPSRCSDTGFFVSRGHPHPHLTTNCLMAIDNGLEQVLLSLPEYALNSELGDLQREFIITIALQYACGRGTISLLKLREMPRLLSRRFALS